MAQQFSFPVWLINLDSNPERYKSAAEQLDKLGFQAERFSAIYGKNLSEQAINACYDSKLNREKFRRPLSAGEIGCYLSHRTLWQRMVDEQIPLALILEDDIDLEAEFVTVLQKISQLDNWDMIKLADDRDGKGEQKLALGDGYELVNFAKVPNCTTGYALTLQGAKKLLSRPRFFRPVDVDLQFYPELGLSVYSILPYRLWSASRFESEIDKMSGGSRKGGTSFWRNLIYRLQLRAVRKKHLSGDLSSVQYKAQSATEKV
ncbi:glycosyltransferase family 25 protein [Rheinheimera aquimaris]|uniref:Glycosyltransferase family 25 protein n=1 Tax=Rheinheimera aquimaris TaxID=412437 RepID=A0ABN1E7Y6_9GAMM|nr:glycosyltransferase family 25 protein [Rheinheimera aquimaris]MCB5214403.1 glycosyltransferase family 25 protein [Rheinheimera aquimaris]